MIQLCQNFQMRIWRFHNFAASARNYFDSKRFFLNFVLADLDECERCFISSAIITDMLSTLFAAHGRVTCCAGRFPWFICNWRRLHNTTNWKVSLLRRASCKASIHWIDTNWLLDSNTILFVSACGWMYARRLEILFIYLMYLSSLDMVACNQMYVLFFAGSVFVSQMLLNADSIARESDCACAHSFGISVVQTFYPIDRSNVRKCWHHCLRRSLCACVHSLRGCAVQAFHCCCIPFERIQARYRCSLHFGFAFDMLSEYSIEATRCRNFPLL